MSYQYCFLRFIQVNNNAQTVYIDQAADMVIAHFASHPIAG